QQILMQGFLKSGAAWIAFVSPATALRDAQDVLYRPAGGEFWASIGFTFCLFLLALTTAGQIVRNSWREPESRRGWLLKEEPWRKWRAGETAARKVFRRHRLDLN